MRTNGDFSRPSNRVAVRARALQAPLPQWPSGASSAGILPRHVAIGLLMLVALFAFEIFNFDTTRYALSNLLGNIRFGGAAWASILAVAFCAIDFAGLVRVFTPEEDGQTPKEVWYLMGAWLLGATMNALMTWWAVSLTLLNHDFGNEVLSREQLLRIVPIFVASLVWLTRILFIGSLTVTTGYFFNKEAGRPSTRVRNNRFSGRETTEVAPTNFRDLDIVPTTNEIPAFLRRRFEPSESRPAQQPQNEARPPQREATYEAPRRENEPRIRQRPPMPQRNGNNRHVMPGAGSR